MISDQHTHVLIRSQHPPVAQMRLNEELNVPWTTVQSFILSVRAAMPNNPYHNWTHVADVVQVRRRAAPLVQANALPRSRFDSISTRGRPSSRACAAKAQHPPAGEHAITAPHPRTRGGPRRTSRPRKTAGKERSRAAAGGGGGGGQTVFSLARASGLEGRMCGRQRLALFLAALCHDIEHPVIAVNRRDDGDDANERKGKERKRRNERRFSPSPSPAKRREGEHQDRVREWRGGGGVKIDR